MGLAEPRKRLKLSKDPNNTTWTKDTTGFGHKIMKSQGWEPGSYLGAKDAPHAEFHTEANASHIRVVLKDDNLGIGAKKGSGLEQGECVGLDVFQNLLGRLNGRDEDELAKEQKSREDLKRAIYTERKWGSIRFVSAGFLIGDKIQDLIAGEAERIRQLDIDSPSGSQSSSDSSSVSDSDATLDPVPKKKKKSKRVIDVEISDTSVVESENGKSKSKKKRKLVETEANDTAIEVKVKKSKKCRRSEVEGDDAKTKSAKRKSKKDKEKKSKKKSIEDSLDSSSTSASKSSKSKSKKNKSEAATRDSSETTPALIDTVPRPILLGGRHAVRSRNIAQKRLAAMDSASLNEIFMIKG